MSPSLVRGVMSAARSCAFVMLESATYIERELPRVHLDATLRAHAERVCSGLIGTKHDILTEVDELDEILLAAGPPAKVARRVERIVRWLEEDVTHAHELVVALESARERDPAYGAACVLVTESAANVLAAFNRTKAAADLFNHDAS